MPRPMRIGRQRAEISLAELGIIDHMAVLSGRPHHRGWSVHSAFHNQRELDQFREQHKDEIEALRVQRPQPVTR